MLALLCLISADLVAQNPLWIAGNQMVQFPETQPPQTLPLPQPSGIAPSLRYNGQIANFNQIIQFDQDGNALFFIVDASIYDAKGYLIASSNDFCSYCNNSYIQGQLAVTMVPKHCNLYYIVYPGFFGVLDLLAQNENFPADSARKGALLPLAQYEEWACLDEPDSSQFEGHFLQTLPSEYQLCGFNGCYIDEGCHPTAQENIGFLPFVDNNNPHGEAMFIEILEVAETNKKYLFIAYSPRIDVYQIEETGIYYLTNITAAPLTDAEGWANCGIECGRFNEYYYAAASIQTDGTTSVVDNIVLAKFNPQMTLLSVMTLSTETLGGATQIGNLEFSASGRYLYFVLNESPYLGYVDLIDGSIHDLTQEVNIPSPQLYRFGQIELQSYEGVTSIFYPTANGFSVLKGADQPSSAVFIANAFPVSGMATTNFDTAPFGQYVYCQEQNYGESQRAQLESLDCCQFRDDISSFPGLTVHTGNDGTWSDAGNPFNNQTSPIIISGDLVFTSGTTTVITNMRFEFGEKANVIIQPGATVRLNGTTWTGRQCPLRMWPGANLLGTYSALNTIDQLPIIGGDQGYLELNQSVIEYAMKAVEVGTTATSTGGIIRAKNSSFINNKFDIVFKPYHFINPQGVYVANRSLFTGCIFSTTALWADNSIQVSDHVQLNEVDGIRFVNCSFMNTRSDATFWLNRGTGIRAKKSSFFVDGNHDQWNGSPADNVNTTFFKLTYGIYSVGYHSPLAFYTCREQVFQENLYGIVNATTDHVMIHENTFHLPDAAGFQSNFSMERGIHLSNSTGFVVEQNSFKGIDYFWVNEPFPCALGVWIDNSGDADNELRNNDFDGLKMGTYVTRENFDFSNLTNDIDTDIILPDQTGLQLFCNTYTNNQTDIFRDKQTTMRWVQGGTQQEVLQGSQPDGVFLAGNRFSADDCLGSQKDFVCDPNNGQHIDYWCHDDPNTIPDCGGISSVFPGMQLLTAISIGEEDYEEHDCPNRFVSGNGLWSPLTIGTLLNDLTNVRNQLHQAKVNYQTVVDHNSTELLLETLQEAFPHESIYYRNLLMQNFPLSDTVLQQLVAEAQRLNAWHLTEVLLANCPLRAEVMLALENSNVLSEFFMSFVRNCDKSNGIRLFMDLNLTRLATQRDELMNDIARIGKQKGMITAALETDEDVFIDILPYLSTLSTTKSITHKRQLAAAWMVNGNFSQALAEIDSTFALQQYAQLLELEESVRGEWPTLDSLQRSNVENMLDQEDNYSHTFTRTILQEIDSHYPEAEPRVPLEFRSAKEYGTTDNTPSVPLLGAWPNPATGTVWVSYPAELDGGCSIKLLDALGKEVTRFTPTSNGLISIETTHLPKGLYLLQLVAFETSVETIKLLLIQQP